MVTGQQIDEKIVSLEKAVEVGLAYFGGEGNGNTKLVLFWWRE